MGGTSKGMAGEGGLGRDGAAFHVKHGLDAMAGGATGSGAVMDHWFG